MADNESWFAFQSKAPEGVSSIDTSAWLDAPAGRHGFVGIDGKDLRFEDGTPVRFWGVNICNARVACPAADARLWAEKLARHGVNCVRFHKFTWHGAGEGVGAAHRSTELEPEGADRWDYFTSVLRERGIYTGWSHIYGHRPRPGDRERVRAWDEVAGSLQNHLRGSTVGLVNFAPDLQDLSIELTVAMLNGYNRHTGLRRADDPALAFIELQNEDNIFFPTTRDAIEACPAYKKLICEMFSGWLRARYGNHDNLVEAWGERAINAYPEYMDGEHLDKGNIYPVAHFWWFGPEGLAAQERERGAKRRLLDTCRFLYDCQVAYYKKFVAAIRETGYRGYIVGSCWQAGSGVSHFYNLHADYLAGAIDRHNYFGGSGGHVIRPEPFDNGAMVSNPGSGLLSTGLQQVADRPFILSEWICRAPDEYTAEGPAVVAVYGLGLQGWDGSFEFASNIPGNPDQLSVYNADAPSQIGLYPALARMIYRGDVSEAAIVSDRPVYVPGLIDGDIGFNEYVTQDRDRKEIAGDIPQAALAVGRVVISFPDSPRRAEPLCLDSLSDKENGVVQSVTGQLSWYRKGRGYFTVDTPGTQAVVGFSESARISLGDTIIEIVNDFAVLFVTSLDKKDCIARADRLLITAVARSRNRGMRFSEEGSTLLDAGGPPIELEGVCATLEVKRRPDKVDIRALDMNGVFSGHTVPCTRTIDGFSFYIDGARYRTIYYEVVCA